MNDLPEVNDDYNNILQTVRMMQILKENTFAYKNVKHQKVVQVFDHVKRTIIAKTRSLKPTTGILDPKKFFNNNGSIEWVRLREYAMRDDASPDYGIVSKVLLNCLF